MAKIELELLEKLEDELHRAARPLEELAQDSPEALRQRRMTAVLEELKAIPLAPMEQAMLLALENPLARACNFWQEADPFGGSGAPNACEITYDFLAKENYDYRDGLLYQRMSDEYEAYLDLVRGMNPQAIIENAYQIIVKEDLLLLFGSSDLDLPEIDVLLTLETPLDTLYWEWLDNDCSHMDMLRDTVVSFAAKEKEALAEYICHPNSEIPERMRDYIALYGNEPEAPDVEPDEELER